MKAQGNHRKYNRARKGNLKPCLIQMKPNSALTEWLEKTPLYRIEAECGLSIYQARETAEHLVLGLKNRDLLEKFFPVLSSKEMLRHCPGFGKAVVL